MKYGSLFSGGLDGLGEGLEMCGINCAWMLEKDKRRRGWLADRWPGVPIYGAIEAVDFTQLEWCDVLCGGFPCQPGSHAGLRKGQDDERWLWPYFEGAISDLRPEYVVIENPTGLLTVGGGGCIEEVLSGLSRLFYNAEGAVISAASVGAPHLRRRLFIVAYRDRDWEQQQTGTVREVRQWAGDGAEIVGHGGGIQAQQPQGRPGDSQHGWTGNRSEAVEHADSQGRAGHAGSNAAEPGRDWQDHGLSGQGAQAVGNDPQERPEGLRAGRKRSAPDDAGQQLLGGPSPGSYRIFDRRPVPSTFWDTAVVAAGRCIKPGLVPLVHGLRGRQARIAAVGDAVCPQQAEYVGQCLLRFHSRRGIV